MNKDNILVEKADINVDNSNDLVDTIMYLDNNLLQVCLHLFFFLCIVSLLQGRAKVVGFSLFFAHPVEPFLYAFDIFLLMKYIPE